MATPFDAKLREAYARLQEARGGTAGVPDIAVETIAALGSGSYAGPDRLELLDRVLAHPVTARELQFFASLSAERPGRRTAPIPTRHREWLLPLAAAVVLSAGIALVRRSARLDGPEVLRGLRDEFAIVEPAAGDALGPRALFVWRAADDAVRYRLELVNESGEQVLSLETGDTTTVLPAELPAGRYQARVTATRRDGTEARTPAAPFTVP